MSSVDRLSDLELLALARFIIRHAALSGGLHWRTRFAQCGRRGWFAPLADRDDEVTLRSLHARDGSSIVCELRTQQVLAAATALSVAQGSGALSLPAMIMSDSREVPSASRGIVVSQGGS